MIRLGGNDVSLQRSFIVLARVMFGLSAMLVWKTGFSADFPIQPYPGAELIEERQSQVPAVHRLPLGGLKRNQGVLLPESSRKISARKVAQTHEIDRSNLPSEVLDYFISQFESEQFEILFQCEAMACGDNSFWANNVFKQRKLNGLDRSQVLLTLKGGGAQGYLLFYLVQRGNKSVYTHTEWFYEVERQASGAKSQSQLYDSLMRHQRVLLEDAVIGVDGSFDVQDNEVLIASIVGLLELYPGLKLALVGHDETKTSVQQSLDFSTLMASSASMAMGAIADGSTLPSYGVGPLAPLVKQDHVKRKPSFWLELVRFP